MFQDDFFLPRMKTCFLRNSLVYDGKPKWGNYCFYNATYRIIEIDSGGGLTSNAPAVPRINGFYLQAMK